MFKKKHRDTEVRKETHIPPRETLLTEYWMKFPTSLLIKYQTKSPLGVPFQSFWKDEDEKRVHGPTVYTPITQDLGQFPISDEGVKFWM